MTRFEPSHLALGSALSLTCPNCNSHRLDYPPLPRGDDAVECMTCSEWFTFAELEDVALYQTRRLLARAFPMLPFDPV